MTVAVGIAVGISVAVVVAVAIAAAISAAAAIVSVANIDLMPKNAATIFTFAFQITILPANCLVDFFLNHVTNLSHINSRLNNKEGKKQWNF